MIAEVANNIDVAFDVLVKIIFFSCIAVVAFSIFRN
jgi:hypothetical protein